MEDKNKKVQMTSNSRVTSRNPTCSLLVVDIKDLKRIVFISPFEGEYEEYFDDDCFRD